MRYKVIGEIQEPMRLIDYGKEGLVSKTAYVILYMEDGSIIEYDLTNQQLPLPSFRALVKVETNDLPRQPSL